MAGRAFCRSFFPACPYWHENCPHLYLAANRHYRVGSGSRWVLQRGGYDVVERPPPQAADTCAGSGGRPGSGENRAFRPVYSPAPPPAVHLGSAQKIAIQSKVQWPVPGRGPFCAPFCYRKGGALYFWPPQGVGFILFLHLFFLFRKKSSDGCGIIFMIYRSFLPLFSGLFH